MGLILLLLFFSFFGLLFEFFSSFGVTMSNFNMEVFALSYILFCRVYLLSLRNLRFSNERQKGVNLDGVGIGGNLGGIVGRGTIVGICCIRKEYFQGKKNTQEKRVRLSLN